MPNKISTLGYGFHRLFYMANTTVRILVSTVKSRLARCRILKDDGESVFVDGVKDTALRSQLGAFLTALGLATPAAKGDEEGAPRGFRCSRGGGGVLRSVAALMDERDLAGPPPLDREAAFDAAKEVITIGRRSVCLRSYNSAASAKFKSRSSYYGSSFF